eukprot:TRINITY_DN9883_c0_g1_i1.p1 TRINITY_DN9883_c0_g1~~TRINITY_DN9883_c0_g1_i1.p1  ORF type:complete len:161 (-),score=49.74 TRINITY_DN9883_c0_g1_i1:61-543(-)
MLVPKKARQLVYSYLFKEGVLVAKKDYRSKHTEIDVPNLYVISLMQSFRSREFVKERFCWNHYYWFLTNAGIEYLREYLHLPESIVPATLKKKAPRQPTGPQGRPYRGGRGGKEAGTDADFNPQFGETTEGGSAEAAAAPEGGRGVARTGTAGAGRGAAI